jgi:hypothetical protein
MAEEKKEQQPQPRLLAPRRTPLEQERQDSYDRVCAAFHAAEDELEEALKQVDAAEAALQEQEARAKEYKAAQEERRKVAEAAKKAGLPYLQLAPRALMKSLFVLFLCMYVLQFGGLFVRTGSEPEPDESALLLELAGERLTKALAKHVAAESAMKKTWDKM